jgi:hypothetical protein
MNGPSAGLPLPLRLLLLLLLAAMGQVPLSHPGQEEARATDGQGERGRRDREGRGKSDRHGHTDRLSLARSVTLSRALTRIQTAKRAAWWILGSGLIACATMVVPCGNGLAVGRDASGRWGRRAGRRAGKSQGRDSGADGRPSCQWVPGAVRFGARWRGEQLVTRLPIGARGDGMGWEALSARDGGEAWTLPVVAALALFHSAYRYRYRSHAPTTLGPPRTILRALSHPRPCLCSCSPHFAPSPQPATIQFPHPHPASRAGSTTGVSSEHTCKVDALVGDPLCKPCHQLSFDSPTQSHVASPSFAPFEKPLAQAPISLDSRLHCNLVCSFYIQIYDSQYRDTKHGTFIPRIPSCQVYCILHIAFPPLNVSYPQRNPNHMQMSVRNLSCWARLHIQPRSQLHYYPPLDDVCTSHERPLNLTVRPSPCRELCWYPMSYVSTITVLWLQIGASARLGANWTAHRAGPSRVQSTCWSAVKSAWKSTVICNLSFVKHATGG